MFKLRKMLEEEAHQKKKLEEEIIILRSQLLQLSYEADQVYKSYTCFHASSKILFYIYTKVMLQFFNSNAALVLLYFTRVRYDGLVEFFTFVTTAM